MFNQTGNAGKLILGMIAAVPLMTACGGGEEESKSSNQKEGGSFNLLGCVAGLILGATDSWCGTSGSSGSSGSSTGTYSGTSSGNSSGTSDPPADSGTIRILGQNEIEPNDDFINANPVNFSSSTDGKVGFKVDASVSDVDDHDDYYTFVRSRARDLRFQLCPPGQMICENGVQVDTLTAFYEVLDQDGNVLASTQAADFNVNVMHVDAGIPYYVRVTAGDTMAATVGYTLTVYETN